ncbi:patatin-like phospholipase family protein [Staphylococcus simiae]|uniref:patatin-like phospholipase family protein n=1 Tax=Staphylococcus simiae TaxID=308354 RepID=UPI0002FC03C9|nr:patatin-like phospholipase family protein [Staphylococcus simiae]SNV80165.1 putative esterase of the alpha-beta hydrolase superfamily [Staphylococcus simiae]
MDKETAIVLGGGGIIGMAWEAGILAALQDKGYELDSANLIIGTSAGFFVGTMLANHRNMRQYYQYLATHHDSNDYNKLDDIYSLWREAFKIGKDNKQHIGQLLGDIIYSNPSKVPLHVR